MRLLPARFPIVYWPHITGRYGCKDAGFGMLWKGQIMRKSRQALAPYEIAQGFDLRGDNEAKLKVILAIYEAMVSYVQEVRGVVERKPRRRIGNADGQ